MTVQQRNVDGPVANLLVELVYGDLSLPTLTFAAVEGGTWDAHSLAEYGGRLRFDESGMKLLIDVTDGAFVVLLEMMSVRNKPATLALSDGSTVTAEFAHMGHLGRIADIDLYQWTWHTLTPARFWLGNLGGRLPSGEISASPAAGGRSTAPTAWRDVSHGTCFQPGATETGMSYWMLGASFRLAMP